jgi:thioredoxin reductase (NADPH)
VKRFLIYGREDCPWCDKAKDLLQSRAFAFEYKNVRESEEIRDELMSQVPEAKTVPQIFCWVPSIGLSYIGGYEDLAEFLDSGII